MNINDKKLNGIRKLCEEYKVRTLSAFDSVIRDDFNNESDIDFVVDFEENDPFEYTNLYFLLKERLEKLLKRQIDLLEYRAIRNKYFLKELDETKVLIYGK